MNGVVPDKTYVALWWDYDENGTNKKKLDEAAGFHNQANYETYGRKKNNGSKGVNGRQREYLSFAYGYRTGEAIFNALMQAYHISTKPIHLVNIFGHGVPAGLTSGYHEGIRGLYSYSRLTDSDGVVRDVDEAHGGRIITNLPTDIFADDVVIVIHNCSTSQHFAVEFLKHLVSNGKVKAKIFAHRNLTGTSFNMQWFEHTKDNPDGVKIAPLNRQYWLYPDSPRRA